MAFEAFQLLTQEIQFKSHSPNTTSEIRSSNASGFIGPSALAARGELDAIGRMADAVDGIARL
jgi:hypothetical protein